MYTGITVGEFLDLVLDGGLPNGYKIYDYHLGQNVYDSEINQDDHDDYLNYEVVNFNITESGVLEINIDTEKE